MFDCWNQHVWLLNPNYLGYGVISSGGTARSLSVAGLAVTDVANLTGFPAILGHRVVTLHPKIHGALLAEGSAEHDADRKKYDIPWIDLVCVDFYPLQQAIEEDKPKAEIIEMIDIGGPTMALSAAKSGRIVICDSDDRRLVLDELERGGDTAELVKYLQWKAFAVNADYRNLAADYLMRFIPDRFLTQ